MFMLLVPGNTDGLIIGNIMDTKFGEVPLHVDRDWRGLPIFDFEDQADEYYDHLDYFTSTLVIVPNMHPNMHPFNKNFHVRIEDAETFSKFVDI